MKIRNLLFGFVLSVMLLCAGNFKTNTAQAFGCTTFCANNYNACMIDCNGDPNCQNQCRSEYYCCMNMCNSQPCF
jgi:hypothetical protein